MSNETLILRIYYGKICYVLLCNLNSTHNSLLLFQINFSLPSNFDNSLRIFGYSIVFPKGFLFIRRINLAFTSNTLSRKETRLFIYCCALSFDWLVGSGARGLRMKESVVKASRKLCVIKYLSSLEFLIPPAKDNLFSRVIFKSIANSTL